ncbi:MAG: hypothetical protein HYW49_00385 [Deltaproteobacteria bacterium]|nr:hypothetical protein [Deltaproteobacteria bacterium]
MLLTSGFTFIRNAVKFDFPIKECIDSMLPIVDELVVNVGLSDDGTEALVAGIAARSSKIRVINSVWDDSKTSEGLVLSEQTNIALDACRGKWCLYLQADEALHENEHRVIARAIETEDRSLIPVDGFRLRYFHFYGGYSMIQRPWNWYPSEIRVIRRDSGARSFGDAQTFRLRAGDRVPRSRLIDAHVYHYGHARAPEVMQKKIAYFHRFWHGDAHSMNSGRAYADGAKNLVWFWGTHPISYLDRVRKGAAWSRRPSEFDARKLERIVILAGKLTGSLAEEARSLLEVHLSKRSETAAPLRIFVCRGFFDWIRVLGGCVIKRGRSALIDLGAETRPLPLFLVWLSDALFGFTRRVAHAPAGKLSRFRAFFYNFVSWGAHERTSEGFRVPEAQHARQLARWLGADC